MSNTPPLTRDSSASSLREPDKEGIEFGSPSAIRRQNSSLILSPLSPTPDKHKQIYQKQNVAPTNVAQQLTKKKEGKKKAEEEHPEIVGLGYQETWRSRDRRNGSDEDRNMGGDDSFLREFAAQLEDSEFVTHQVEDGDPLLMDLAERFSDNDEVRSDAPKKNKNKKRKAGKGDDFGDGGDLKKLEEKKQILAGKIGEARRWWIVWFEAAGEGQKIESEVEELLADKDSKEEVRRLLLKVANEEKVAELLEDYDNKEEMVELLRTAKVKERAEEFFKGTKIAEEDLKSERIASKKEKEGDLASAQKRRMAIKRRQDFSALVFDGFTYDEPSARIIGGCLEWAVQEFGLDQDLTKLDHELRWCKYTTERFSDFVKLLEEKMLLIEKEVIRNESPNNSLQLDGDAHEQSFYFEGSPPQTPPQTPPQATRTREEFLYISPDSVATSNNPVQFNNSVQTTPQSVVSGVSSVFPGLKNEASPIGNEGMIKSLSGIAFPKSKSVKFLRIDSAEKPFDQVSDDGSDAGSYHSENNGYVSHVSYATLGLNMTVADIIRSKSVNTFGDSKYEEVFEKLRYINRDFQGEKYENSYEEYKHPHVRRALYKVWATKRSEDAARSGNNAYDPLNYKLDDKDKGVLVWLASLKDERGKRSDDAALYDKEEKGKIKETVDLWLSLLPKDPKLQENCFYDVMQCDSNLDGQISFTEKTKFSQSKFGLKRNENGEPELYLYDPTQHRVKSRKESDLVISTDSSRSSSPSGSISPLSIRSFSNISQNNSANTSPSNSPSNSPSRTRSSSISSTQSKEGSRNSQ